MTVTARIEACGRVAAVRLSPSWWDRLLGTEERDRLAVLVPDIGGGTAWHWDSTAQRITDRRVIDALATAGKRPAGT